jgi:AraC-like DNA-binding protein
MDAYADLRERISERLSTAERGNPKPTAEAILKIVDAEEPPLRFIVGNGGLPMARAAYAARLATWETWEADIQRSARRAVEKYNCKVLAKATDQRRFTGNVAAPGPIQTEYMRRRHVAHAQSLLSCPDLEVSDIALASGFCDQSDFHHCIPQGRGQAASALSLSHLTGFFG